MKRFINGFLTSLLIIGVTINVAPDIPFWQQLIAYVMIACIMPLSDLLQENALKSSRKKGK